MKKTHRIGKMNYLDSARDSMWQNVLTPMVNTDDGVGNSAVSGRLDLQHGRGQHGVPKRLFEQCVFSKNWGFCW